MLVYRVRNKQTGEYLKANARTNWSGTGSAKNAWYGVHGGLRLPKWGEQTEWEVVKCEIVPLEVVE